MFKINKSYFLKKSITQINISILSFFCIFMLPSAMAQSKNNEVIAHDLYKGLNGLLKCNIIQMKEGSTGVQSAMDIPITLKLNGDEGIMEYANNSYPIIYRATNLDNMQYAVVDSKNNFFLAVYIVINQKNLKPSQLKLFSRRYDFRGVC